MSVSAYPFHTLAAQALQGNVKYEASGGDTIKCALFTTQPTLTTADFSSLTGEITGTGYTAGGASLASLTVTETEANSWSTTWAASTVYAAGAIIRPGTGNGYLYECVVAGTSAATTPTFPTVVGETVTDGTATWACVGEAITVFSSAAVSWASSTITADYAVIYDSTSGANIVEIDFGGSQSDSSGTFTITAATFGWLWASPN